MPSCLGDINTVKPLKSWDGFVPEWLLLSYMLPAWYVEVGLAWMPPSFFSMMQNNTGIL